MDTAAKEDIMGVIKGGASSLLAALAQDIKNVDKKVAGIVEATVNYVHFSLMAKTPVYTGQTVRNYRWSIGGKVSSPPLDAIDNGPMGITSQMPLGVEPRRAPNEADATKTLKALSFSNPYKVYTVNNNSPAVLGLEMGELPGNGKKSRSPNGMFMITETAAKSKLKLGTLK